jgi:hypothetical protein
MKLKLKRYLFIFLLLMAAFAEPVLAQKALSAEEIEQYSSDAEKLVSFLQFTFNTIGSADVPVKEKDIIINQSFSKFFADENVQIEDDLDENREVPINKDVQAYLKDIDFFFDSVQFEFSIQSIEHQINENNQLFFKVTLNRNLKGVTVLGDTVDNNRIRYIEINLDDVAKDLKIASIYTTKLNEKEELRKWWRELPQAWKDVLGANIILHDTIRMKDVTWYNDSLAKMNYLVKWRMSRDTLTFESQDSMYISLGDTASHITLGLLDRQIRKITQLDTINISGNSAIFSLEPLSKLDELRRIDCSFTMIDELMPLRNLTKLEFLNCAHTSVKSLDALKYSTNLEELIINHTLITEIDPVVNFTALEKFHFNHTEVDSLNPLAEIFTLKDLEMASTKVDNLDAIQHLTSLERLDFSGTPVNDLTPLTGLKNIFFLKVENTQIENLQPLKDLSGLHFLFADQTKIADLSPLNGLPELSKIYCDKTGVTRQEAISFMDKNPNTLVIYESADLISWWEKLPLAWRDVFSKSVSLVSNPSKEELHQIIKIKTINIAGNTRIQSLDPLSNLSQLKEIYCQGTSIDNLEALRSLADLRILNFTDTKVKDISPLASLTKLGKLTFDRTLVSSIEPLMQLGELTNVYCDQTQIPETEIISFMLAHPDCLVVYQTAELELWWDKLPEVWKLLAEQFLNTHDQLAREQLQELVNLKRIDLSDFPEMEQRSIEINSLENIHKLLFLEELKFSNTSITSLEPLRGNTMLKVLVCNNNPIESLDPLSEVPNLEVLDVQNTPIASLEFLAGLHALKKLNCSGTQIKNLKGLENLNSLEQLDCYNTSIKKLDELEYILTLKLIRCYNTRINDRRVEKFKQARPEVEIVFY